MPKTDFTQYDKDPANNTDVDGVDIAEGCAPSGINNAIRSVMSHIAEMNDGTVPLASPDINGGTIDGAVIGGSTPAAVTTSSLVATTADINGGTIDGVTIGGASAGAGTFTTVTADGLTLNDGTNTVDITSSGSDTRLGFVADRASSNLSAFRFQDSSGEVRLDIADGGDISFYEDTGTTPKLFWDASAEYLGLGTTSPDTNLHVYHGTRNNVAVFESGDADVAVYLRDSNSTVISAVGIGATTDDLTLRAGNAERMRIDSSGNLLVGKADADFDVAGILMGGGVIHGIRNNAHPLALNRQTSDGDIIQFYKDGSTVGSISVHASDLHIGTGDVGLRFYDGGDAILPRNSDGNNRDGLIDMGGPSGVAGRFDTFFAVNTSVSTSDANDKQQISGLTEAEIVAAKAISKLFKTYKWNTAVEIKGDAARTHTGVIAQDVQQAMTDAGLDASKYAFWCSDTWWETQTEVPAVEAVEAVDAVYEDVVIPAVEEQLDEEGNVIVEAQPERVEQRLVSEAVEAVEGKEAYTRTDTYETAEEAPAGATERTRLGIRYPELLAFIGAATEQRLASIEARLDALEA